MFDRLRSALSTLASAATQRSLSESELDKLLWDFELALLESDVATEVVEALTRDLKTELAGQKIKRTTNSSDFVQQALRTSLHRVFTRAGQFDLFARIEAKRSAGQPFIILFLGINGTGKTTTIAKLAHLLKKRGFSVVVASADTHRAGAIEQLGEHAHRLSVRHVAQKYGADPAAVARDAVLHAQSQRMDIVLIDTAGRMQTSRNLMEEMAKIVRVVRPDLKLFVGDALVGNDAVSQAQQFLSFTDFDAVILSKAEADVKGGAALSIVHVTQRPIIYLGVGQAYDDLVPFHPELFLEGMLGKSAPFW
jgi:fused signal recognition particle receptor